jgi:RHS repeat-associated protein
LHLERIRSRYTGKERDTESGNDYFEARYYSSAMGRFMSPDWSAKEEPVPYAKLDDPQSLNLYAYVYNNPLARADADGHWPACLSAAETYVEDGLAELVDKATADGAEMIAGAGGISASAVAIGASVPLVVATIFAPPVGGDMTPEQQKEHDESEREPQTATGGAGARQGGGGAYDNTPENQARMAKGLPPIGKDGKPVELHHSDQTQGGGTQEMTRTDHRAGANYAANHTNTGQQKSKINRQQFAQQRRAHWKNKVKPKPTSWRRTFRSRPHSQWVTAYQNRWTTVRKAAARTRES